MFTVSLNGETTRLPDTVETIQAALEVWSPEEPYALAVNDVFVPRSRYTATPLTAGDNVDILSPITGG